MDLSIYQIFFRQTQYTLLDSALLPFNNSLDSSGLLEYGVFRRLHQNADLSEQSHWGAVSWRFKEKTGLVGKELISTVESNPNIDVFFCNPFPHVEALYQSVWLNGETSHPQLLNLSRECLALAGQPTTEVLRVAHSSEYSFCNYFVGSKHFWSLYIPFVDHILHKAENELPEHLLQLLRSSKADPRNLHHGASYIPFLIERLFPLFMRTAGRSLKAYKYPLPVCEARLSPELRDLRAMKDAAVLTRSERIYKMWQTQRNQYMLKHHSEKWCKQFLPMLNPDMVVWG